MGAIVVAYQHSSKCCLCSTEERKPDRFGMIWWRVNDFCLNKWLIWWQIWSSRILSACWGLKVKGMTTSRPTQIARADLLKVILLWFFITGECRYVGLDTSRNSFVWSFSPGVESFWTAADCVWETTKYHNSCQMSVVWLKLRMFSNMWSLISLVHWTWLFLAQ